LAKLRELPVLHPNQFNMNFDNVSLTLTRDLGNQSVCSGPTTGNICVKFGDYKYEKLSIEKV